MRRSGWGPPEKDPYRGHLASGPPVPLPPSAPHVGRLRSTDAAAIKPFLAQDIDAGNEEDDVEAAEDEGEIFFVEVKTARFLHMLGLPLPEDLLRLKVDAGH